MLLYLQGRVIAKLSEDKNRQHILWERGGRRKSKKGRG